MSKIGTAVESGGRSFESAVHTMKLTEHSIHHSQGPPPSCSQSSWSLPRLLSPPLSGLRTADLGVAQAQPLAQAQALAVKCH